MDAKVFSIETTCFNVSQSEPRRLSIQAAGRVNSTEWSNGRLIPWMHIDPPADGVIDFDFIATSSGSDVIWVMSPIVGIAIVPMQSWLSGYRIHSATGTHEVSLKDEVRMVAASTAAVHHLEWPMSVQ